MFRKPRIEIRLAAVQLALRRLQTAARAEADHYRERRILRRIELIHVVLTAQKQLVSHSTNTYCKTPKRADAVTISADTRGAFHLPFAASPTSVPKFQKVFGIDNLVEIPFCLDLL